MSRTSNEDVGSAMGSNTPVERTGGSDGGAESVPRRWRNLLILAGLGTVDNTEASITSGLFPSIAGALRLDNGHLGLMSTVGKVVGVPAGPLWAWIATRYGRRATLSVVSLLAGLFGIAAGCAQNFWQLLLLTTLMSATVMGAAPLSIAAISDSFGSGERGRALGYFGGVTALLVGVATPLLTALTGVPDGWRYAFWIVGALCVLMAGVVVFFFVDPRVGAADKQLAGLRDKPEHRGKVGILSLFSLFRIPSYSVLMVSRLLYGQSLITVYGIQFLATERGFSNAEAGLAFAPWVLGFLVGNVGGGFLPVVLDRFLPGRGSLVLLQSSQVVLAVTALFGTQFNYDSLGFYAAVWGVFGMCQGMATTTSRLLVGAVVRPELRGMAFATWLSGVETVAFALFALIAGSLTASSGLQGVLFWGLVVLMLISAALVSVLYFVLNRDVRRAGLEPEPGSRSAPLKPDAL